MVTINITYQNYYDPNKGIMEVGEVVRIKGSKRIHMTVIKSESSIGEYTLKPVYIPSPKSKLRKLPKSPFSNLKIKIYK